MLGRFKPKPPVPMIPDLCPAGARGPGEPGQCQLGVQGCALALAPGKPGGTCRGGGSRAGRTMLAREQGRSRGNSRGLRARRALARGAGGPRNPPAPWRGDSSARAPAGTVTMPGHRAHVGACPCVLQHTQNCACAGARAGAGSGARTGPLASSPQCQESRAGVASPRKHCQEPREAPMD